MKYSMFYSLMIFLIIGCGRKTEPDKSNLGELEFKVTGTPEAMPFFEDGLLLLHSFEFKAAAKEFVKAQELDSNFVMAFWGEAMSFNHPLWKQRFSEKGLAALHKLGLNKEERLAKAKTEIERDFMEGVEILYSEGDKKELDVAYKDHMKSLYAKYPGHHEVAAFYALSLLGASDGRTKDDFYEKGANIVQSIIDENADHPGALHYLIHSYDDPDHATLALDAANRYANVAPDAEHALHMPSHIFIALGMWDEVISSNIASFEASVARKEKEELDNDALGYHAFKWLMYAHLQKGNTQKAKEMLYEMWAYCSEKPSSKARAHFIMMKADYLTETGQWSDPIADTTMALHKLNLMPKGVQSFTQGMLAYYRQDKEKLDDAINELYEMQTEAEAKMVLGEPKMCSGVSRYMQPPTKNEVQGVKVLGCELKAALALIDVNEEASEDWLKKATALEEASNFTFGPPSIVKPSFEMYGEWLVEKGRKKEAKEQFEKALERAPKRRLAVMGLEKANS